MTIYWGDGTNTTTNPTGGKIVQVTSSDFTTQASNSANQKQHSEVLGLLGPPLKEHSYQLIKSIENKQNLTFLEPPSQTTMTRSEAGSRAGRPAGQAILAII